MGDRKIGSAMRSGNVFRGFADPIVSIMLWRLPAPADVTA